MQPQDLDKRIQTARNQGYSDEQINSALKAKGVFAPSLNPVWGQGEGTNKLAEFTGSSSLGKWLGGKLYSTGLFGGKGELDTATAELQNTLTKLDAQIQKGKMLGKDTTALERIKTQTEMQLKESQNTQQQLMSGGVTGKQALGSAIQTASFALPATKLAGKALGSTKIGKGLTALDEAARYSPVKYGAVEGALSGAVFGAGRGLEKDTGMIQTAIGYGVGGGAAGAILNPILSPLINGAVKTLAPKLNTFFSKAPQSVIDSFRIKAADGLNKGLGLGNMKGKQIVDALGSADAINEMPYFRWMDSLYNRADNIKIYDKSRNPISFNPLKTKTANEFFQATYQGKQQVQQEIFALMDSVGNKNFQPLYDNMFKQMDSIITDPRYGSEVRSYINKVKGDLIRSRTYKDLYDYSTVTLSKDVDKAFSPSAESKIADVSPKVKKIISNALDQHLNQFTEGPLFEKLRLEHGAYQSVEDTLEAYLRKEFATDADALYAIDNYGLSNIISGLQFQNYAQAGKGASFSILKILDKLTTKTKPKEIQEAFKAFQEYFNLSGYTKGHTPPDFKKIYESYLGKTTTDIVPVGEVTPTSRMEMPAPAPKFPDEAGIPKPPIRQAEEATRAQGLLGEPGQGPFGYKGEGIPVAPAGKTGMELTSKEGIGKYIPRTQQELEQMPPEELKQLILDFLGGKKKIDSEGGSITGAILTFLSGITGSATLAQWAKNTEPTVVVNEDKVSPTKVYENQEQKLPPPLTASNGVTYEARPVPKEFQSAIQKAYAKNPDLPKGILEMILNVESIMGTTPNPDLGKDFFEGEYGWMVGAQKKPHASNIKQKIKEGDKRYRPDMVKFDTPEDAIMSTANFLSQFKKGILETGEPFDLTDVKRLYNSKWQGDASKTVDEAIEYYANAYSNLYK